MVRLCRRGLIAAGWVFAVVGGAHGQLVPVDPLPPLNLPAAPLERAVGGTTLPPLPPLPPIPPPDALPPVVPVQPTSTATGPLSPPPLPTSFRPTIQPGQVAVGRRVDPTAATVLPPGPIAPDKIMPVDPPPRPELPAAPPVSAPAPRLFEAYWNNGLFFRSADGGFTAHVGASLHYDGAWYTGGTGVQTLPGGVGRFSDGVAARRLRLLMDGSLYSNVDYKLDVELANGFQPAGLTAPTAASTVANSLGLADAWVTLKEVPFLGNVRVGNQKEWFSLEHLESQRALMFMERSYLFDATQPTAFNNARSPGLSAFRTWANDRVFTGVGVYKNVSDTFGFGVGDGQYAVTGRVAALPVWCPEEQYYWHVGGAMSHRDPVDGQVRVRVRNAIRNAPAPLLNLIADTGAITSASQDLFNLETAAAYGPVTVSSEYTANLIRGARVGAGPNLGTLVYNGFYTQGMVFLTGEHREWDPKTGVFKRVIPLRNLSFKDGTFGAVETGVRYSYLDLDDEGVNGGRLNGLTLGLTWYWNANVRLQFNYDYLYRDGGPNPLVKGAIHSFGTRLAVDF
jgi:phosphate-selective porin OprO/OprP